MFEVIRNLTNWAGLQNKMLKDSRCVHGKSRKVKYNKKFFANRIVFSNIKL